MGQPLVGEGVSKRVQELTSNGSQPRNARRAWRTVGARVRLHRLLHSDRMSEICNKSSQHSVKGTRDIETGE